MKFLALALLSVPAFADPAFVNAKSLDYSLRLDVRYATKKNFTKKIVYPEAKCLLRKPVAEALSRAQSALKLQGYGIKIFDCYRPLSIQKAFWALVPDERYVANPEKGSRHNRGAAIDVALVDRLGKDLEMPSEFDDFTERAHRDYAKSSKKAREHVKILDAVLSNEGFEGMSTEWWHYDFKGWEAFPIEDVPLSSVP